MQEIQNIEHLMNENPKVDNKLILKEQEARVWNSKDSMQFIEQLKKHSALWKPSSYNSSEVSVALGEICKELNFSHAKILQKLKIFHQTCAEELDKIAQDSNYTPLIPWWGQVESFIQPQPEFEVRDVKEEEIDTEEMEETQWDYANPLPSVAPPSVMPPSVQQAMNDLFYSNDEENYDDAEDANLTDKSGKPFKMIWNGLEEDLLEGKWSLKHSVKFLRLYGAHRCLWDLTDPNYRSREMRQVAIKDIAASMGYGLNADYVAKKIKIFRITYMQHRKRMLSCWKQGKNPDIQLRWFPLADSFLRPHIGLRSIKKTDDEMPQFDYQYVYANLNLIDPSLLTDFRHNIQKEGSQKQ